MKTLLNVFHIVSTPFRPLKNDNQLLQIILCLNLLRLLL